MFFVNLVFTSIAGEDLCYGVIPTEYWNEVCQGQDI